MSWSRQGKQEGVRAHDLLRVDGRPLAALLRSEDDRWAASLLAIEETQTVLIYFAASLTLEEAKRSAEESLRHLGWRL